MALPRPPGPPALPVVGSLIPYMYDRPRFLMENYRRYGETVGFHFLQFKGAILHGAAANRYILADAVENFLVEPAVERAYSRWIVGRGLLFIDDPAHRQERRLIMPAFHRKRLEQYQQVMVEVAEQIMTRWRPGVEIDVAQEMDDLALIVAGRTLFSIDLSREAQELSAAVGVVVSVMNDAFRMGLAQLPFDVAGVGHGASLRRGIARVDAILGRIIAAHEREGHDSGDMVSMLVAARDEEGSRLTAQQVRDHLLTLFVAGHETVANALAFAFYLLAQHPTVTARLLAELDRELHGRASTPADLERLPYLEQVMKEVLRILHPASTLVRIAAQPFEWQGYHLDAGDIVIYSPYVSHHMPSQFPEPEVFRPERFDPALGAPPPSYAYIPFGAGPRSCVGAPFATLEIKTVLALILPRWRLDLMPGQQVEAVMRTTLQPEYGIRMRPWPQDAHPERSPAPVRGNVAGATPGPP